MIQLTEDQKLFLSNLVKEQYPEKFDEVNGKLIEGFERFASPEILEKYFKNSVEKMIKDRLKWLYENIDKAGKRSEDVFASQEGRERILALLKRQNVPPKNLDLLADDIIFKFWRLNHAEKYNPILASWNHHVSNAVRTCVYSFWGRRSRQPDETGVSINQERTQRISEEECHMEPFEKDQTDHAPENIAMFGEFMAEFEEFLTQEPLFRTIIFTGHKKYALLRVGESYKKVYLKTQGAKTYRICDEDTAESPSYLVSVDEFQKDATGKITIFKNNRVPGKETRMERGPKDVYDLLMKGYQVDEIAKTLSVGNSTAHTWVRKLEELFSEYWELTDIVPEEKKHLAAKYYKCPTCGKMNTETKCDNPVNELETCGTDLSNVKWVIPFMKVFPWGIVRGSQEIKERADLYKCGRSAIVCGM